MKLTIQKRDTVWKQSANLRKQWSVPGIVYGRHVDTPIKVLFNKNEFLKLYKEAWESTPVNLEWDGIKQMVLIYDIQRHSVTNYVQHVDFLAIRADEKVRAEIPVELVWETTLVKEIDCKIEKVKDTVYVEALPADLPHVIQIDISVIKTINDTIFVSDLVLWDKVEIKDSGDLPIVTVITIKDEPEVEETPVGEWESTTAEWEKKDEKESKE